jgi:phenylalanyl-tRNA synthetase alpha chain
MSSMNGSRHPMSQVIAIVARSFRELGFDIADGPEIETDYNCFEALNIPKDHPSRDMQDTFWIKDTLDTVMRTQTSAVQIRYMQQHTPPFKVVVPGSKVYRREATDATHEAQFYQMECMVVDKDVTLADLKGALEYILQKLFGEEVVSRFRPSYFPFVEPALEVDMSCFRCKGTGKIGLERCTTCKGAQWIEIMGAGMVHPNVLQNGGINPTQWKGYAFAIGLDRIVMLKYGIEDIRMIYQGDLRMINQF